MADAKRTATEGRVCVLQAASRGGAKGNPLERRFRLLGMGTAREGFGGSTPAITLMKINPSSRRFADHWKAAPGKIGWILLWLIGVPIPILLIFFLLRGCT